MPPQVDTVGVQDLLFEALSQAGSVEEIRQVNLCVNGRNAVALRLCEFVGFETFGRERDAMLIEGELHDEVNMSLRLKGD